MNLKCAIVDDEPLALGLRKASVNKTLFLELAGNTPVPCKPSRSCPKSTSTCFSSTSRCPNWNDLTQRCRFQYQASLHHRLRPSRHRTAMQRQCAGLLAETHLLHRLSAGCQQGCTMVRTAATAKGRNSEYFRKERV